MSIGIESEEHTVQRPSLSDWKPFEQTQVNPLLFETQSVFILSEHEKGPLKSLKLKWKSLTYQKLAGVVTTMSSTQLSNSQASV